MEWKSTPKKGIFLRRYKRFFADVDFDGQLETAHVANTGSLKSVLEPNREALLWPSDNPARKLKWSLFALRSPDGRTWMGIDTSVPNRIVEETFQLKLNPDWVQFEKFQREVKIDSHTRLDGLFFDKKGPRRYLEIKNVSLREGSQVLFPDAVTERGLKHIEVMMSLMKEGFECELCFIVQRQDCNSFSVAESLDPAYAKALRRALAKGLKVTAWVVAIDENGARWTGNRLPVEL